MAPSHDGEPVGSILGPMGSTWVQKNGSKPCKITMPQKSNFRLPCYHQFFPKNGSYGYGTKSRWGLPRVHHGANGSHWVKKMGQKRSKLPCPKIRIFDFPAVIDFWQKMEVTVMAPNQGGDPVGSILGAMGSHWVQKMGQNCKKLPCPKNSNFRLPCYHRFFPKNGSYGYGEKSRWGPPRVHLGANGVPLGKKKWFESVKNYHAPKFEFSTTPRSSIFP